MTAAKDDRPAIITLMGATACGKTEVALALHEHLSIEIVSVDATQVYRQLNIGSAKPASDVLSAIPHWLIDIADPSDPYSVAKFIGDARRAIQTILDRGKTPLLVGGSMMYFRALLEGLSDLPDADEAIRARLQRTIADQGVDHLYQQLQRVDPRTAARLHPRQSQRIQRALEVFELTGRPLSELQERVSRPGLQQHYQICQLALWPNDRALLHRRIEERFDAMLRSGLCNEVEALYRRGDLHANLPALRAVGYRQIWRFLDGHGDLKEARERSIIATRQLAKRQLTWLRRWPGVQYICIDECGQLIDVKKITQLCLKSLLKHPMLSHVDV